MKTVKIVFTVCCVFCMLWLCACTAQPTEPASTTAQTQTEAVSDEAQSVREAATETSTVPQPATLSVKLADSAAVPNSVHVTADSGEPAAHVVFTTDRPIRHVQVLSLMMQDFDEETGKPVYDVTTVGSIAEVTPEQPLVVTTVFYGDLPNNGISYADADGSVHRFAVEMSGEDGSLLLTAF